MDLKRRRDSSTIEIANALKKTEDEFQKFNASIMDVVEPIFIDILLRLPIKEILICKCTCKTWYHLISRPEFAEMHFARSRNCLLLRNLDSSCVPRLFYLIDPCEIDVKSCLGCDENFYKSLDAKLKIPLRNPEMALNMDNVKNRRVKLRLTDHKLKIVNSYNGFLCLSEPSTNEPVLVCNPVTGEYINIPEAEDAYEGYVDCGLGFNPVTNQYTVIRIFDSEDSELSYCPIAQRESYTNKVAEIHRLGEFSWENIGFAPKYYRKLMSPTYLSGTLHWLHHSLWDSNFILSFDFTTERFQNFPGPTFGTLEFHTSDTPYISMGVLKGNLCLCHATYTSISLWVMEKYGVQESWTRIARVRKEEYIDRNLLCQPIDYLKCGSFLMFFLSKNALIHYDFEREEWIYLNVCGIKPKCEAVVLVPSLFSLKDAVQGNSNLVLNIGSRCGKIKLQGERKALYIVEAKNGKVYRHRDFKSYWVGDDLTDDEEWWKRVEEEW